MMQEGSRMRIADDLLALRHDIETVERLHRRLRLAFDGTEGGEIMLADQRAGAFLHGRPIERTHASSPTVLERS